MLPPEIDFPESSAVASCCVVLPTQAGVAAQPTTCAYTPVHSGVGISNLKEGGGGARSLARMGANDLLEETTNLSQKSDLCLWARPP